MSFARSTLCILRANPFISRRFKLRPDITRHLKLTPVIIQTGLFAMSSTKAKDSKDKIPVVDKKEAKPEESSEKLTRKNVLAKEQSHKGQQYCQHQLKPQ